MQKIKVHTIAERKFRINKSNGPSKKERKRF